MHISPIIPTLVISSLLLATPPAMAVETSIKAEAWQQNILLRDADRRYDTALRQAKTSIPQGDHVSARPLIDRLDHETKPANAIDLERAAARLKNIPTSVMLLDHMDAQTARFDKAARLRAKAPDMIEGARKTLKETRNELAEPSAGERLSKAINALNGERESLNPDRLQKLENNLDKAITAVGSSHARWRRIQRENEERRRAEAAARQTEQAQTPVMAQTAVGAQDATQTYTPAYQSTASAPVASSSTGITGTCGNGGGDLRSQCQSAIDQGGLTEMPIFDGLQGSRLIAGHRQTGGGWIANLQPGQSTPYGTVQWVQHNATPDTVNNGGLGTYLQTCDENGNPIIVKVK